MVARRSPRGCRAGLIAAGCYGVLAVVLTHRVWGNPTHRWLGASQDPQLFLWWMSWVPHSIAHGLNPLHPTVVQYPLGTNSLWNTSIVLPSLLMAPITLWFGPILSWNLLMTASPVLSGLAARAVIGRFVHHPSASLVGGLVYGFSPYMIVELEGHAHLLITIFPPVALLCLHELFIRQRRSPRLVGVALGLAATAQLLIGEEVLLVTAIGCGLVAVIVLSRSTTQLRQRMARGLSGLVIAGLVALGTGGPLIGFQFAGPQAAGCCLPNISRYVLDAETLVVPTGYQLLHTTGTKEIAARWRGFNESNGYLGVPLIVLIAAALVVMRRRAEIVAAGIVLATSTVLAFGSFIEVGGISTGIPAPWQLLRHLPVLGDVVVSRFMLLAYLAIATIVAVTIDALLDQPPGRRRQALLGATALTLATLAPSPTIASADQTPRVFSDHAALDRLLPHRAVAIAVPYFEYDSMFWQVTSDYRFNLIQGGVIVPGPQVNGPITPLAQRLEVLANGSASAVPILPAERQSYLGYLRKSGVNAVIVGPSTGQSQVLRFLRDLLHIHGQRNGTVTIFANWR